LTAVPLLVRSLRYGGAFALAVAVIGGGVGFAVAGGRGLAAALLGAALAAVFLGLTALSIIVAARATAGDPGSPVFFGVVLGVWFLKLLIFLGVVIWLRSQTWLDPWVFFITVIVAVLGSLVLDVVAYQRTRTPYVDVALPGEGGDADGKPDSSTARS
jgi:amino acid transporter